MTHDLSLIRRCKTNVVDTSALNKKASLNVSIWFLSDIKQEACNYFAFINDYKKFQESKFQNSDVCFL
jgi:hypothetical protein